VQQPGRNDGRRTAVESKANRSCNNRLVYILQGSQEQLWGLVVKVINVKKL